MRSTIASALIVLWALPQTAPVDKKPLWKPVDFAILRFNDEAPKDWNIYHTEKRGLVLLKLWKRYLFLDLKEQEVYEIDPETVKPQGDNVEWSMTDIPKDPLEISEWKTRDVGSVRRVRFRFGKTGHFLEMQIPLKINGKPWF
ncbi:MAG: hypothetical protein ABSH39_06005 [Candidatus Acidiferrum sp.]|jgi:hypothetical protein